ncbi:hypothetical protein JXI42_14870 [bacterium]|nr:hypothetical protein [bacterium]
MKKIALILATAALILGGCMTQLQTGTVMAEPCIHIEFDWWDCYDCYDHCDGWHWVRCNCCDCCDCECWCWRPTFWYCLFHDCSRPPRQWYHHRTYIDGRWRYYTENGSYYHYTPQEGIFVTRRGMERATPDQREKSTGFREAERAEPSREYRTADKVVRSSAEKKEEEPVYRTKSSSGSSSSSRSAPASRTKSSSSSSRSSSSSSSRSSKSTTRRTK